MNREETGVEVTERVSNMADAGVEEVTSKVRDILLPVGLESHPFKVKNSFYTLLITHLQRDRFE